MLELLVLLIVCVCLMLVGSDVLVKSIIEFANKIDISPHFITILSVSLGSSIPEMLNSIIFAMNKLPQVGLFIILNNLVIDFTLIMGFGILVLRSLKEITYNKEYILLMTFVFIIFVMFIVDGKMTSVEGSILFLLYPVVFLLLFRKYSKKLKRKKLKHITFKDCLKYCFLIGASIFVLLVNANMIYLFAKVLIKYYKLPYYIVGFLLGFFTVTPELLVLLVSYFSIRRADIAVFNLFGSFLTDLTLGIGIPAAIMGYCIKSGIFIVYISLVMLYISLAISDLIIIRKNLPKEVGYLLIGGYILYMASLFIK